MIWLSSQEALSQGITHRGAAGAALHKASPNLLLRFLTLPGPPVRARTSQRERAGPTDVFPSSPSSRPW